LGDGATREQAARCLAAALPYPDMTAGRNGQAQRTLQLTVEGQALALSAAGADAGAAGQAGTPRAARSVLNAAGGVLLDGQPVVAGMDGDSNAELAMTLLPMLSAGGPKQCRRGGRTRRRRRGGARRAAICSRWA